MSFICQIVLCDSFLLKHEGLAIPTLRLCLEAFTWTDGESVTKISSYCSVLVVLAIVTNHAELVEYVSRDLFTSLIQGLTLESNAITSADLVAICREIFVYLCDRHPAPRQVSIFLVFHHLAIFFLLLTTFGIWSSFAKNGLLKLLLLNNVFVYSF